MLVILFVMRAADAFATKFGARLGERTADDFYDWVTSLAQKRREETHSGDPPPDFYKWTTRQIEEGMRGELAQLLEIDDDRFQLLFAERVEPLAFRAHYRDDETGREYSVEVARDEAIFRRIRPAIESSPAAARHKWWRGRR